MPTQIQQLSRAIADPASFATTLVTVAVDQFGMDVLQWHPETTSLEIRDTFGTIPPANYDRLMAGLALVRTDSFYHAAPDFVHLCRILSGHSTLVEGWEPSDAVMCAWGITEAMLLGPPENEHEPFSDDIRRYIGVVLDDEWIIDAPDVLRIAIRPRPKSLSVLAHAPEIVKLAQQVQEAKVEEINDTIRDGIARLLQQLEALPLEHGNTSDLLDRLRSQK